MANIPRPRAVLKHGTTWSAGIQPLAVVYWPYTTPPHAKLLKYVMSIQQQIGSGTRQLNHVIFFVGRTEKACASKETYKPDSVTPALSGGMGQNSPNVLWEACGRLPEMFDPS